MTQHFVCSFNETHAIMQQLVRSKTATDVLEAIEFYKTAYTFNLAFANEGFYILKLYYNNLSFIDLVRYYKFSSMCKAKLKRTNIYNSIK